MVMAKGRKGILFRQLSLEWEADCRDASVADMVMHQADLLGFSACLLDFLDASGSPHPHAGKVCMPMRPQTSP